MTGRRNLAAHASDLAGASERPVTLAELDRLVLRNNPDLRAARAKLGVAEAQLIEADLLPNPQIGFSYPFFLAGPNGSDAFSVSVAQDLRSILLRPTKIEAAGAAAAAINASLIWQEWQTLGKARLLFVDIASGERLEKALARNHKFLQERFDLTSAAINQGNAPLANLSPDLVAVGDAAKGYDDLERLQLSRRHQLNALLGLEPDAPLRLAGASETPHVDAARVRRDLASLADRRPDLSPCNMAIDRRMRSFVRRSCRNSPTSPSGWSAAATAARSIPSARRSHSSCRHSIATRALSPSSRRRARSLIASSMRD